MTNLLAVALLALGNNSAPDNQFEAVAASEIRELIHGELLGHYEVRSVSVLEIKDHTAEWGGFMHGYGLRTVTASFVAVRNAYWSEALNREVVEANCNSAPLYILCRPTGHEFSGKLETDMAFTAGGWKVLSRNYRNLSEFPLSRYLLLGDKNPP